MVEQRFHSAFDFISDSPNFINGLPFGITERPIVAAQPWNVWALVAATHRDKKLRVPCQFLCQFLRLSTTEVDPDLLHCHKNLGMNSQAGLCSRRYGFSLRWICKLIEKCCRHL